MDSMICHHQRIDQSGSHIGHAVREKVCVRGLSYIVLCICAIADKTNIVGSVYLTAKLFLPSLYRTSTYGYHCRIRRRRIP